MTDEVRQLPGDGWIEWTVRSPRFSPWPAVEIMRREWDFPQTISPRGLHPEMNAIGLYWRPIP